MSIEHSTVSSRYLQADIKKVKTLLDMRIDEIVSILFYCAAIASYYIPAEYAVSSRLYDVWQMLVFAESLLFTVKYITRERVTLSWWLLAIFFISYYPISVLMSANNQSLNRAIFLCVKSIGFISLINLLLSKDYNKCIRYFLIGSLIVCSIHYYTYIEYAGVSGGMRSGVVVNGYMKATRQRWFFLTHDNGSLFYFLPVVAVMWSHAFNGHRGLVPLALVLSVLIEYMYIRLWSVSAMVVFGAYLLFVLLSYNRLGIVHIVPRSAISISIAIVISVIIIITVNSNTMNTVVSMFGKNSTLEARRIIWQSSLDWFRTSPLIGMGYDTGSLTMGRIGINHCHNYLIQILYTGGILTMSIYILALFSCVSTNDCVTYSSQMIITALFLLIIASCFDWYPHFTPQFILMLIYKQTAENTVSQNETVAQ